MPSFEPIFPLAAITDEFSPNLAEALPVMKEIGMTGVELRTIGGVNILDLDIDTLKRTRNQLQDGGMRVVSIASPLLKCILPEAPALDERFQQDAFASRHTYADQDRLTQRAFEIANFFEAPLIRVFSYWRTIAPEQCHTAIVQALSRLAELAGGANLTIGLENEHACNIGTGAEAARFLDAVPDRRLRLVWDPANALVAGEQAFPNGYNLLPKDRIAHVHAKDCHLEGHTPVWGPLGTRHVPWKKQIRALRQDGYKGYLSLETHWPGPNGNKLEASRICGWNLRGLAAC